MFRLTCALIAISAVIPAADLAGSKDPPGMKRYEGSEIIGYREPKFDEYLLPLGAPTSQSPPKYVKQESWGGYGAETNQSVSLPSGSECCCG
jgi:hypothetical protein